LVSFWLQAPSPSTQARTTTVPSVPKPSGGSEVSQFTVRPASLVVSQTRSLSEPFSMLLQALSFSLGSTESADTRATVGPIRATASIAATASQPIMRIADARVVRSPMDSSLIR
jgi:hypothetical protein